MSGVSTARFKRDDLSILGQRQLFLSCHRLIQAENAFTGGGECANVGHGNIFLRNKKLNLGVWSRVKFKR